MNRDIAVIGMACVFPRAPDLGRFWENNVNAFDCITEIPAERWPDTDFSQLPESHEVWIPCTRGGFIPVEARVNARKFGVMPQALENGDPEQFIMLALNQLALEDANVGEEDPIRRRADVIIGRGGYTSLKMSENCLRVDLVARVMPVLRRSLPNLREQDLAALEAHLRSTLPPCDPEGIISAIPNLVASRISNRLNLLGAAYVVDAACASSLVAVEQAVDRLRSGQCDLALASGIHLCQNPAFWMVFSQLRAISPSGVVRPFDRRADGLLLGEGAGVVALKRLTDAHRDGDRVYAVIKGVGSASDGRVTGLLAPASSGQVEALRRAYADAQVDPAAISYLEAHGTATMAGDAVEIVTINTIFGESRFPTRVLGSVKSLIGHAMPAAGIASLIRTVMALANRVLPPTLHCEEPRPELQHSSFSITRQARPWVHSADAGPRRAGVSAFGFGGINAHVVLEEAPEHSAFADAPCARPFWDARQRPSEPLLFAAATRDELTEQLQALSAQLDSVSPDHRLEDVAFTLISSLNADQPCKLALICRDLAEAKMLLAGVREKLARGDIPSGDPRVFFAAHPPEPPGKLAVVYPGMAFPGFLGEFPQRLMELCLHFPELRGVLDRLESKDGDASDPVPLSHLFSPPETLPLETRDALKARLAPAKPQRTAAEEGATASRAEVRNLATIGVVVSNELSARLLSALGLEVEMICGQSLGELSALCEAGALDLYQDLVPRLWAQATADCGALRTSKFVYVAAGADDIVPFLEKATNCGLAIDRAPQAVIVGGPGAEIDRLASELRAAGIVAAGAPFVAAHMAHLSGRRSGPGLVFDEQAVPIQPPRIPVYSSIIAAPFPNDPQAIVTLLAANFERPVRAWQTIRRLYEDGARFLIWAGCGAAVSLSEDEVATSGMVRATVDREDCPPITQLNRLVAAAFTAGLPFRPEAMYRHRRPRHLATAAPHSHAEGSTWIHFRWPFSVPQEFPQAEADAATPTILPVEPIRSSSASVQDRVSPSGEDTTSLARNGDTAGRQAAFDSACSRLPFAGELREYTPGQSIAIRRVLDLDEDLYLQDHCFVNAVPYKPVEDCMPVFPLVMMIEAMAEAAAHLAPGLGLIGAHEIRAERWISLLQRRRSELVIEAVVVACGEHAHQCRVEARILHQGEPSASATLLFGREYGRELSWQVAELDAAGPWPISAEELYRERYTFHGPRFRTVSHLEALGSNGLTGVLRVLPKHDLFASSSDPQLLTDPAVIDGAGQVLGAWAQAYGAYVLPTAIEHIEFYTPPPRIGADVFLRAEIVRVVPNQEVVANMEILDDQGQVWMRLAGWRDQVISDAPRVMDMQRMPHCRTLATIESLDGGPSDALRASVRECDLGASGFSWLAQLYLTAEELAASRNMVGQRPSQYVLGRIAAKDAVRFWLAQSTGGTMLHPALIVIDASPEGQPVVRPLPGVGALPKISIAHSSGTAVAAASSQAVGVDVEAAASPTTELLSEFATTDEAALLPSLGEAREEGAWSQRLWCAKEAVGKAVGTGLAGRPLDFEMVHAAPDGRLTIRHRPSAQVWLVHTVLRDGFIYADCHAAPAVAEDRRTTRTNSLGVA